MKIFELIWGFFAGNIDKYGFIIGGIINYVIVTILFCIVVVIIPEKRTKKKAEKLEKKSAKEFLKYVPQAYPNVIMHDVNGNTFEMDIAFATKKGIFCVECKHHGGNMYVTGSVDGQNWFLEGDMRPVNITNPLRQNYGHIYKLLRVLNADIPCFNIAVTDVSFYLMCFGVERSSRDNSMLHIKADDAFVLYHTSDAYKQLFEKMEEFPDVLTDDTVKSINDLLEKHIADKETQKKHKQYVMEQEYLHNNKI